MQPMIVTAISVGIDIPERLVVPGGAPRGAPQVPSFKAPGVETSGVGFVLKREHLEESMQRRDAETGLWNRG